MRGPSIRAIRLAALQLALAAMVLRALIPAGWMPNPGGAATGTPLVICAMQGLVTIRIGPDGNPVKQAPVQDDHGQAHDHDICPFAAAGQLASPAPAVGLPPQLPIPAIKWFAWADDAPRALEHHSIHPPRAPPRLA